MDTNLTNDTITGMAFNNEKLYETRRQRGDCLAYEKSSVFGAFLGRFVHWGQSIAYVTEDGTKYSEIKS